MTRWTEQALWLGAIATLVLTFAFGRPREVPAGDDGANGTNAPGPIASVPSNLGVLATSVAANDPFRISRRPADLPFGATDTPSPARPMRSGFVPVVSGIFGPPWRAVLEGVPGHESGVVVRASDTLGTVRVVRVTRDSVVLQAPDTTWRLTLRSPQ